MPVKNVKRKTNDGFEGVITGLNDKEKEIISNSVGIEANPTDTATATLNKLKVADTTYNVGVENIKADGTYVGEDGGMIINSFSLTTEQREKIKSGNVLSISGNFALSRGETSYGTTYIGSTNSENAFSGINISGAENISLALTLLSIPKSDESEIEAYLVEFLMIPPLPSDSSSKTYTLRSVNGTLTWVDTSVGTQYFEDINVGGVSLDDKISSAINSAITSTLEVNY